jgi:hypothetical protein
VDSTHRYFRKDLQPDGTWNKGRTVRGVTTILGDTLEKKGLQNWSMGLALQELFGFYDFTPDGGKRLTGFSKGKGTIWSSDLLDEDTVLSLVLSASKASYRKMNQGADIGTLVHSAIEDYVRGNFRKLDESGFTGEEMVVAIAAFNSFQTWWEATSPKLLGSEQMVYSNELDYSGAYDGLLEIDGKIILADWKTSNASASAGAPQGAYYSYFAQSAAYALALKEMTGQKVDDLLVVSCRKDGKFDTVYLSDLGFTVAEAVAYWRAIVTCYRSMDKLKKALVANAK